MIEDEQNLIKAQKDVFPQHKYNNVNTVKLKAPK